MTMPSIEGGPRFSEENVCDSQSGSESRSEGRSPSSPLSPYSLELEFEFQLRQGLEPPKWRPQRNSKKPDRLVNAPGTPKGDGSVSPREYYHAMIEELGINGGRVWDADDPIDDPDETCWQCAKLEAKFAAVNETNRLLEAESAVVKARNHSLEAESAAVNETNRVLEAEIDSLREKRVTNLFTGSDDDL
jgi:FtsZ-binding cell division protein ZapB